MPQTHTHTHTHAHTHTHRVSERTKYNKAHQKKQLKKDVLIRASKRREREYEPYPPQGHKGMAHALVLSLDVAFFPPHRGSSTCPCG